MQRIEIDKKIEEKVERIFKIAKEVHKFRKEYRSAWKILEDEIKINDKWNVVRLEDEDIKLKVYFEIKRSIKMEKEDDERNNIYKKRAEEYSNIILNPFK